MNLLILILILFKLNHFLNMGDLFSAKADKPSLESSFYNRFSTIVFDAI
jgi:hypothetical protein